jgi:hypothetical protein
LLCLGQALKGEVMKTRALFAFLGSGLLLAAADVAPQDAAPPTTNRKTKIELQPAPKSGAPAAKDAKKDAAKDAKKKEDEKMGKVEGMEIAHGKGFMGLRVVDGMFRLTFYNEKRKPVPPDVSRVALRWDAKYKIGDERVVLLPGGDANSLTSSKVIRPPLTFKLFMTLIKDVESGGEPKTETLVVDFSQAS